MINFAQVSFMLKMLYLEVLMTADIFSLTELIHVYIVEQQIDNTENLFYMDAATKNGNSIKQSGSGQIQGYQEEGGHSKSGVRTTKKEGGEGGTQTIYIHGDEMWESKVCYKLCMQVWKTVIISD